MNALLPRCFVTLALFSLAPVLNAALMVDWGGGYTTANRAFSNPNPGTAIGVTQYGGFSSGSPLLLSPSANYTGTSSRFYGEIIRTSGTSTFTSDPSGNLGGTAIIDKSSTDQLALKLDGTNSAASALYLWKQADFLNGLNSGTLNLGSGSMVTTAVDTFVLGVAGRAVVKSAGSYYISSAIFSAAGSSSLDLTTLSWFAYTPATSISTVGTAYSLVNNGVINDVSEIGYFTGVSGTGSNAVRLSSVEFNYVAGAVIPEPSTYATLAGMFILAICTLRRRHT